MREGAVGLRNRHAVLWDAHGGLQEQGILVQEQVTCLVAMQRASSAHADLWEPQWGAQWSFFAAQCQQLCAELPLAPLVPNETCAVPRSCRSPRA